MTDSEKLAAVRAEVATLQRHAVEVRIPATTSTTTGVAGRCQAILDVIDYGVVPNYPHSLCDPKRGSDGAFDWRWFGWEFLKQERERFSDAEALAIERFLDRYR